jgi:tetratricopeptide (TPR) repeat protein
MKRMILTGMLAFGASVAALMAQQPAAPAAPAAPKGPAPKSKGEQETLMALQTALQAQNWDNVIAAAEDLNTKYTDSDFKEIATYYEAVAYQEKNDWIKADIYGEKVLEINPKNIQATLLVGELLAKHTRENDLDKEEKLAKAEKMLNATIENVKTGGKPNPQLTDAQWAEQQKYLIAEAEDNLGLCALSRKAYDKAVPHFRAAVENDPQPAYNVQLASALQSSGKNDEAIAICDKLLADPQLHPSIKQVATNVKTAATQAKGGK